MVELSDRNCPIRLSSSFHPTFAGQKNIETMLYTNLKHIESAKAHEKAISENENVMICCGRMGPMCIPVYEIMEELEKEYPHVTFYDMEFDHPDAHVIRHAPMCRNFMGLPFTVYYKNGQMVKATSSIQNADQITAILNEYLPAPVNA
jgi:thioredoxin 1